jgi:hypothetical protein
MTVAALTRRPTRQAAIRDLLDRILTRPAPTNHQDRRAGTYDRAAIQLQLKRAEILQLLYGRDEVAAGYHQWIETSARAQAATTDPITSWDELALDTTPLPRWRQDRHGFLCYCCGDHFWQVYIKSEGDLMCKGCARSLAGDDPHDSWDAPTFSIRDVIPVRLPDAHGQLAFARDDLGSEPENQLGIVDHTGVDHRYGLGDAGAFLLSEGWMGMETERWVDGPLHQPTMVVTGYTPRPGHWFTFMAAFEFDLTPQPWHRRPYGFRFTFGTITASGGRTADFDEPFTMLDTIIRGEDAISRRH